MVESEQGDSAGKRGLEGWKASMGKGAETRNLERLMDAGKRGFERWMGAGNRGLERRVGAGKRGLERWMGAGKRGLERRVGAGKRGLERWVGAGKRGLESLYDEAMYHTYIRHLRYPVDRRRQRDSVRTRRNVGAVYNYLNFVQRPELFLLLFKK